MAAGVGLKPVYSTTEKMSNRGLNSNVIGKLTLQLCEEVRHEIPEVLPQELIQQYKLISRAEALVQLHAPANAEKLEQARRRLKFEELFFLQLQVLQSKLAGTVTTQRCTCWPKWASASSLSSPSNIAETCVTGITRLATFTRTSPLGP
jgi:RecG-like helicase